MKESLEFLIFWARLVGEENEKHMFRVLHVLPKKKKIIIISLFLFLKKKKKKVRIFLLFLSDVAF